MKRQEEHMTLLMLGDFPEKLTVKVSSIVHRLPAKYIVQDTWQEAVFFTLRREKTQWGIFFSFLLYIRISCFSFFNVINIAVAK